MLLAELDCWDADLNELDEGGSDDLEVLANFGRQIVHIAHDSRKAELALKFTKTRRPVFEVVLKGHDRRVHGLIAELGKFVQTTGD